MKTIFSENLNAKKDISSSLEGIGKKLKYISMYQGNLDLLGDMFHSDNKKILILDIDGTLNKFKEEFKQSDNEGYERALKKLTPHDKPFKSLVDFKNESGSVFLKSIYKYLDVRPLEFELAMGEMNYGSYGEKNDRLCEYLSKSNYRIWCFTNGSKYRAELILKAIDLEDIVEGVICVDNYDRTPIIKPEPSSYEFVEKLLGLTSDDTIYFFDDLRPNVEGALKAGWKAFQVKPTDDIVSLLKTKLK